MSRHSTQILLTFISIFTREIPYSNPQKNTFTTHLKRKKSQPKPRYNQPHPQPKTISITPLCNRNLDRITPRIYFTARRRYDERNSRGATRRDWVRIDGISTGIRPVGTRREVRWPAAGIAGPLPVVNADAFIVDLAGNVSGFGWG